MCIRDRYSTGNGNTVSSTTAEQDDDEEEDVDDNNGGHCDSPVNVVDDNPTSTSSSNE